MNSFQTVIRGLSLFLLILCLLTGCTKNTLTQEHEPPPFDPVEKYSSNIHNNDGELIIPEIEGHLLLEGEELEYYLYVMAEFEKERQSVSCDKYTIFPQTYTDESKYNDIQVDYPYISGLDGNLTDTINKILFTTAFCGLDFTDSITATTRINYQIMSYSDSIISIYFSGYWHEGEGINLPLKYAITVNIDTGEAFALTDFYALEMIREMFSKHKFYPARDENLFWSAEYYRLYEPPFFHSEPHYHDYFILGETVAIIVPVLDGANLLMFGRPSG